jgi:hypothetical protein
MATLHKPRVPPRAPQRTCELCRNTFPRVQVDDVFVAALGRYVGACRSPQHDEWRAAAYRTDPSRSTVAATVHLVGPIVAFLAAVLIVVAGAAYVRGWIQ